MNRLVNRLSEFKKSRFLHAENGDSPYPYCQITKFIQAELSKDQNALGKAAQAVFYWPGMRDYFTGDTSNEENLQPSEPILQYVKIKKKRRKDKHLEAYFKRGQLSPRVKGENVSDEVTEEMLPIEVSSEKTLKNIKSSGSAPKISKARNSKLALQKQKTPNTSNNWKDWNLNNMNSIKLSDYTNWLNNINQDKKTENKSNMASQENVNKQEKPIKTRARLSVNLNEEVISEPLADLLTDQGHFSAAIVMYEKLSLIFPEKSSLFALKIKALKK